MINQALHQETPAPTTIMGTVLIIFVMQDRQGATTRMTSVTLKATNGANPTIQVAMVMMSFAKTIETINIDVKAKHTESTKNTHDTKLVHNRSEERRVGKECRL